jgi:hypothetical protein
VRTKEQTQTFDNVAEAMIAAALFDGKIPIEGEDDKRVYTVTWTESGHD